MEEKRPQQKVSLKRVYNPPEIVHELELETRAGSPLGLPDPVDLTGE
jgi:hypothetical protein